MAQSQKGWVTVRCDGSELGGMDWFNVREMELQSCKGQVRDEMDQSQEGWMDVSK